MPDETLNLHIKAHDNASAALVGVTSKLDGLMSMAVKLGGVLAAGLAFKNIIDSTEEWSNSTHILQKDLGVTSEEASKLLFVGKSVGLGVEDLDKSFGILAKTMLKHAQATAPAHDAFAQLGIKVTDAQGKLKGFDQIVPEINDKIRALGPGFEKTGMLMELFGRSGKEMNDLLSLTPAAMLAIEQRAESLGMVLSETAQEKLHEFTLEQRQFGLAWDGLKIQLGQAIMPVLTALMNTFVDFTSRILPQLKAQFEEIGKVVAPLWTAFMQLWDALIKVRTAIWNSIASGREFSGVMKVLGDSFRVVLGIIKEVADRLSGFADEISKKGLIGAFVDLAKDILQKVGEALGNVGSWVAENWPKWRDALGQLFLNLLDWVDKTGIPSVQRAFQTYVVPFGKWIVASVPVWLQNFGNLVTDFLTWFRNTGWPRIVALLEENIPKFGKWILDSAPEWLSNLGTLLGSILKWIIGTLIPEFMKTLGTIVDELPKWAAGIAKWYTEEAWPILMPAISAFATSIVEGIVGGLADLGSKMGAELLKQFGITDFDLGMFHLHNGRLTVDPIDVGFNIHWNPFTGVLPNPFASGGDNNNTTVTSSGDTGVVRTTGPAVDLGQIHLPFGIGGGSKPDTQPAPQPPDISPIAGTGGSDSGGGGNAEFLSPMARGGIVMRPTRALVGEAGPEAVIPLSQLRGGMGGGGGGGGNTVININVHDNVTDSNERLADRVSDTLLRRISFQRRMSF